MVEDNTRHYAKVNGLNMYYEDHGRGPPLVLIHGGIGTSGMNWAPSFPMFSKHYRIIAPDSRGHGRTDNPSGEFSYKLMADDTVKLIEKLELEKPAIYGWSDGGQIALEIGMNYPGLARAIISGGVLSELSEHYLNGMRSFGALGPGKVSFDKFKETYPEFAGAMIELHSPVYGDNYFVEDLFVNISKMWFNPKEFPGDRLTTISDPTLILHGDRDEVIPLEDPIRIYRMIPNSELAIVPGTDHGSCITQPERIAGIIIDYLQRLEG
ncbi:MAG: alpha/beta fold hydrolase [Candidatus Thorarchaeota archaeon]